MLRNEADAYREALRAAALTPDTVEPEAQLTVPFSNFLTAFANEAGIGDLRLFREARLDNIRPDFAVSIDGRPCGWVELKAPSFSVDASSWRGRQQRRQWEHLALLDSVLVSNGSRVRLYREGKQVGADATLPNVAPAEWDGRPLERLLRLFVEMRPTPIRRVSSLASRLAPLARMLRDRIAEGLSSATPSPPIQRAKKQWAAHVHEGVTDRAFADDLAQVIAYSLAIAALEGAADLNGNRVLDLAEARQALKESNGVLAAALGPALEVPGLRAALDSEIGAIERLVSVVDVEAVHRSKDPRGEPWLWFYEDFLHHYDAEAQRKAGVYYTPIEVVNAQVKAVDHILRNKLNKRLGFGDKTVVTLDPATGSGTYPLAVLDRAAAVAVAERGPAGPKQVAHNLVENLIAFELLPGPYAVSHLRIGQRLAELADAFMPPGNVRVYLTDTLDDPDREVPTLDLWGDVGVLADERRRAAEVKSSQPVTVVIGNPPYHRRSADSGGGWVVHPGYGRGRAIFDDLLDAARRHGVIFSAQASLYNDYVYFWRWAMWKAFEQDPSRPAVVSFITASSWLTGDGFVGLRELALQHADEIWVTDLGGSNKGALKEDNVFAIETAVAIVTMYRKGRSTGSRAKVFYSRLSGTRLEKLAGVARLGLPGADDAWSEVDTDHVGAMVPRSGGERWTRMVPLTDVFPWQQPGAMFNRSWPIAPDRDTLRRRWRAFVGAPTLEERERLYVTPRTGRNIYTEVAGLPPLAELARDAPHMPIVRYGYRSFDNEWTFEDPRLAALERPSLWRSRSELQVFLATMNTNPLGPGPALTVTTEPPDKHFFANRGGKDIMPLYRDAACTSANVTGGLPEALADAYGYSVTPSDVLAYVYALLAHPAYYETFQEELATPGLRVPFTADPSIFSDARELGYRLLWLQTFGSRFGEKVGQDVLPDVPGLAWVESVTSPPRDMEAIRFDPARLLLTVGEGVVSGVIPAVWDFKVSGYPVLQRWLGRRTLKGVGRAASEKTATPLDRIRPTEWVDEWNDELLDLLRVLTATVESQPAHARLLKRVLDADMLDPATLPTPTAAERRVPKG